MTYRQPAFMLNDYVGQITDVANDVWDTGISPSLTNSEKRNFVDGRISSTVSYTASSTFPYIRMDFGDVLPTSPDRWIVPATHSGFVGRSIRAYSDDNSGFTSIIQRGVQVVTSNDQVIDVAIGVPGDERYWMLGESASTAGDQYTLRGWWLGNYEQLTSSAAVDPTFELGWREQISSTQYPGGTAVAQISPPRRTFTLRVRDVDPSGADYDLLDRVMQKWDRPFWYWPPDNTDPGPFYVRHAARPRRLQDFRAPTAALRYRFEFSFIEDNL